MLSRILARSPALSALLFALLAGAPIAAQTPLESVQWSRSNTEKLDSIKQLDKFAFGSCNSVYRDQPLWEWIEKDKPQLWIWGGDNVYADSSDFRDIKAAFDLQNKVPGYKRLKTTTPIIGTWDDHDFGHDNAGFELPFKMASQSYFLDFLEVPEDSPRRVRDGVYTSYEFGPAGKKAKIILLDNRYFHQHPDRSGTILGEEQWEWLEDELKNSDAQVHFIVSGLSVLSWTIRRTEEWRQHPAAFHRLKALLKKYDPKGLVFLTGDKHFASVFLRPEGLEFMSSGLTHTVQGRVVRTYVARFYPNAFFGLNYGLVKIDWKKKPLQISLAVKTYQENPIFRFTYKLNPLNQWEMVESLQFPALVNKAQSFSF